MVKIGVKNMGDKVGIKERERRRRRGSRIKKITNDGWRGGNRGGGEKRGNKKPAAAYKRELGTKEERERGKWKKQK